MTDEQKYNATQTGGQLVIDGPVFSEYDDGAWDVRPIDEKRILLVSGEGAEGMSKAESGHMVCAVNVLKDFLIGLSSSQWSGCIYLDTGFGIKRIYFNRGDVVFAASNIIDDRLGEVIFRESKIELDELTNSAAQVTKMRKFGQVLLSSGVFDNVDLYKALKLQVSSIVRTVFMVDKVYVELEEGIGKAPTEVIFEEGTRNLLVECYAYGCSFRDFLGQLNSQSEIHLIDGMHTDDLPKGTFDGDLLEMIREEPNVQNLLAKSKLMDVNTIAALADLCNEGYCSVTKVSSPDGRKVTGALKAKIDSYAHVHSSILKACSKAGVEFPLKDAIKFADGLNPSGFHSIYLDLNGGLSKTCIEGLFSQCAYSPMREDYFKSRIESLIQFLLQFAGDNLDWNEAKALRQEYRAISS